jgi:hypothetical protein
VPGDAVSPVGYRRQGAFLDWASTLTLDDIGGAAALFGLLFAMLCVGGW